MAAESASLAASVAGAGGAPALVAALVTSAEAARGGAPRAAWGGTRRRASRRRTRRWARSSRCAPWPSAAKVDAFRGRCAPRWWRCSAQRTNEPRPRDGAARARRGRRRRGRQPAASGGIALLCEGLVRAPRHAGRCAPPSPWPQAPSAQAAQPPLASAPGDDPRPAPAPASRPAPRPQPLAFHLRPHRSPRQVHGRAGAPPRLRTSCPRRLAAQRGGHRRGAGRGGRALRAARPRRDERRLDALAALSSLCAPGALREQLLVADALGAPRPRARSAGGVLSRSAPAPRDPRAGGARRGGAAARIPRRRRALRRALAPGGPPERGRTHGATRRRRSLTRRPTSTASSSPRGALPPLCAQLASGAPTRACARARSRPWPTSPSSTRRRSWRRVAAAPRRAALRGRAGARAHEPRACACNMRTLSARTHPPEPHASSQPAQRRCGCTALLNVLGATDAGAVPAAQLLQGGIAHALAALRTRTPTSASTRSSSPARSRRSRHSRARSSRRAR